MLYDVVTGPNFFCEVMNIFIVCFTKLLVLFVDNVADCHDQSSHNFHTETPKIVSSPDDGDDDRNEEPFYSVITGRFESRPRVFEASRFRERESLSAYGSTNETIPTDGALSLQKPAESAVSLSDISSSGAEMRAYT
jgi:hypothetical protein